MGRLVTLAQIAEKTGFSINAVSRALNDKSDISDATKELIKKAAQEMGYVVNCSAKALRLGKTNMVAIIIPNLFEPSYTMMANELEQRLSAFGYLVIIFSSNDNEEKEHKSVTTALSSGVDGVIICPMDTDTVGMRKLISAGVPFVSVEKYVGYPKAGYVMYDDTRGGFIAAEYLLNLGHTDIIAVMKNSDDYCTQQRVDGIVGCFAVSGRNIDGNAIKYINTKKKSEIEEELTDILENSQYTAIICGNDILAMRVLYLLHKGGKRIPEDVSVVAFGNRWPQTVTYPLLTIVSGPYERLSASAAEILIKKMKEEDGTDNVILPVELDIRESTASPKIK